MSKEECLYAVALRLSPNIGDQNFRKLISAYSSAREVWETPAHELCKIDGLGKKTVNGIGDPAILKAAEEELLYCEDQGISILARHFDAYPAHLANCDDAPAILMLKGCIPQQKKLSIVGTRKITPYGKQFIADFIKAVPEHSLVTVSGMALGVDAEVHYKSLECGIPTIAVLAHGFRFLYPAAHRKLSQEIIEAGGALITEFTSHRKPDRENFIQRNRVIAGFSQATLVVETGFGGGSISTANFANMYNRDVYALPGRYNDVHSQGCNLLIYQNKAMAISTIDKLMEDLGLGVSEAGEYQASLFDIRELISSLPEAQQNVLEVIHKGSGAIQLDELSLKVQMLPHELMGMLLEMELAGLIKSTASRTYSLA